MPKRRRFDDDDNDSEDLEANCCMDANRGEIPMEKENCSSAVSDAMSALTQSHLTFSRAYLKVKNRMDELGDAFKENPNSMGGEIMALNSELEFFWEFYVRLLERKNALKAAWEKQKTEFSFPNKRSCHPIEGGDDDELQVYSTLVKEKGKAQNKLTVTPPRMLSPENNPRIHSTSSSTSTKSKASTVKTPSSSREVAGLPALNSPSDDYHRHQFESPSPSHARHANSVEDSPPPSSPPTPPLIECPEKLAADGIKKILDSAAEIAERGEQTPKAILINPSAGPKCVPKKGPIPARFSGDVDKFKNYELPDFRSLCNYADSQGCTMGLAKDMRFCVMCGQACPCATGQKAKTKKKSNVGDAPVIPTQNKGLCTHCDVKVWIIVERDVEIKWCKGCKNFKPWAAFGHKGSGTKCVPCRERLREMYARSKERSSHQKKLC